MNEVISLASEAHERGLWNPTILGVLVFASAVVLFCGSVYLLLGTNLGGRLGFLVSFAALTGMLTLIASLWLTTATPLNSPHGRNATWLTVEVAATAAEAKTEAVRDIEQSGREIDKSEFALIQPSVDAALVIPSDPTGETEAGPLAIVPKQNDIILQKSWQTGGEDRLLFGHEPLYQVVQFCQDDNSDDPGPSSVEVEPTPECDLEKGSQVIVFKRDFGSLRLPPAMYLLAFGTLFGLSLLALHWRERDQQRDAAAAAAAATVATKESGE